MPSAHRRNPAAARIAEHLVRRTAEARDGYAARGTLGHPMAVSLATDRQAENCPELVRVCALGAGSVPDELYSDLSAALRTSGAVIRRSLTAVERPDYAVAGAVDAGTSGQRS